MLCCSPLCMRFETREFETRDSNASNPWLLTRATQAQNRALLCWISTPLHLTGWDEDYWRWLYCRLTASETVMEPRAEHRGAKEGLIQIPG